MDGECVEIENWEKDIYKFCIRKLIINSICVCSSIIVLYFMVYYLWLGKLFGYNFIYDLDWVFLNFNFVL